MKHLLSILLLLSVFSLEIHAEDLPLCLRYWYSQNVSTNVPDLDSIAIITEGRLDWKISPHPTKAQLVALEPVAIAWQTNQLAEVESNLDEVSPKVLKAMVKGLIKVINVRLPAGSKITAAELKAAIKENL